MNKSGMDSSNHTALYHGMSMKRVFVPGERLFLRQIAPEALVCGDVVAITYPDRGKDVVHRVIRIGNGELQTMGDNNATPDDVMKFTEKRHFYLVTGAEDLHSGLAEQAEEPVQGAQDDQQDPQNGIGTGAELFRILCLSRSAVRLQE